MALFLSTYTNKVDKKGRVSVPATFRAVLLDQPFQGIVLFRSAQHQALEGFSWSYMEQLSERLDDFDLMSAEQDDLAATIFADSVQLSFDGDGRIVLPEDLRNFADIDEKAAFVGMGRKFQVWNPVALEERRLTARQNVKNNKLTVPNNIKGNVS